MTVTMIKRRRDDLTLRLTGLVHARTFFEARGATPEDTDTLDHQTERIRSELARLSCKAAAWKRGSSTTAKLAGTGRFTAVSGRSVLRCSGRANRRDPVMPPHLPGGKTERRPQPTDAKVWRPEW